MKWGTVWSNNIILLINEKLNHCIYNNCLLLLMDLNFLNNLKGVIEVYIGIDSWL